MTKQKGTKRALYMSVLSLLVCMSMLIGSTFAWFTDSVTSGNNKIQSGNLNVELWHCPNNQSTWGHGYDEAAGTEIKGDTDLFLNIDGDPIRWEPGAGVGETFRVKNAGSLALNFMLNIKAVDTTETPEGKGLTDILSMQIIELQTLENGAPAFVPDGVWYEDLLGDGYVIEGSLLPGETADFNVAIDWIPSSKDNEYNVEGGLSVDFSVTLLATQMTYEKDSFDDQYDANATYPILAGDVDALDDALANAEAGDVILLTEAADYGLVKLTEDLEDVTIDAAGNKDIQFNVAASTTLKNVTIKSLDLAAYNGQSSYGGAISIEDGASVDITFDNCVFRPNSGYSGVRSYSSDAELEFVNCTFEGGRYAFYKSGAPIKSLSFENCTFKNQSSWIAQTHGGTEATTLSVVNCQFDGCTGGLFKCGGAYAAGSVFTFVDNTLSGTCTGHDGKDNKYFELNVANADCTISGNIRNGVAWEPAEADGLTK